MPETFRLAATSLIARLAQRAVEGLQREQRRRATVGFPAKSQFLRSKMLKVIRKPF